MQIKLKELLENMTAEGGERAAAAESSGDGGVVEEAVEDGPSVASACPPTPRRSNSSIQAAIDAATLDIDSDEQADFFNPPAEEEVVSHRPRRRTTPPPPPPRREEEEEEAPPQVAAAPAGEDEFELQTFSPGMLSPLSRRPPSGIIDPPVKPPKRDSGLIDVRSMAAAYREYDGLVKKTKDSTSSSTDVETAPLPILGAGDHTSPILLPQPQAPAHASKWLYALVAVLGLIVVIGSTVAVTALILKRRNGGGGESFAALSPDERTALCVADEEARLREEEERERIAAARRAPAAVPGTLSESDEVTADDLAGPAPVATPVSASSSRRDDGDDDDDRRHRRRGHDGDAEDPRGSSPATTAAVTSPPPAAPTPTATPAPAPSKPAASDDLATAAGSAASSGGEEGEKCDEVTCLVSGKGCCGKNAKGAAPKADDGPAPDPNLPARPERSDISAGIASVQSRLQSCGDRHSVRGAVTVKIGIAPSGEVKSASTSQGSAEFQSCIAGAIKSAKFPATQQGAKVSYPVMLK